MAELQFNRPMLVDALRRELHQIDITEEVISRLQDVIDDEWRSVRDARSRLKAMLELAGVPLPSDPGDYEHAAQRFVDEALAEVGAQ